MSPCIFAHNTPYISIDQKSHVRMKCMLLIKNFSNRSQTNGIYDLWCILTCNSSQTSTSNSKYNPRYGHLDFLFVLFIRLYPAVLNQVVFLTKAKVVVYFVLNRSRASRGSNTQLKKTTIHSVFCTKRWGRVSKKLHLQSWNANLIGYCYQISWSLP